MLCVSAIAGVMVSSLDKKMQARGAQCALKPTLYHRVHTACVTEDVLPTKCAALFGIFFFFFQNAGLQKWGGKKRQMTDQSINH